jgi:nucleoside-diphosphate-sugar epimerase
MSILITGGSGFIGSHFHRLLSKEQIVNLDLVEPNFSHQAKFIKGDIRIEEDIVRAMQGNQVDAIISLAAKHHDFGIGHDEYFDTNEEGTRIICNVASRFNIKKIIFFSSVAVYGIRAEASTEATEPKPDSDYGASKLAGENVLKQWCQHDPGRSVILIRPTVVFGPNNLANMMSLIKQIDSGFYFHIGRGDTIKSIAYVENLVEATMFLLKGIAPGVTVYNYADEPQLSTRQISTIIAERLQKKIRFTVPMAIALLFGLPFDILIKVTGKNFPISTARIRKLATQTLHSAHKLKGIGFVPRFTTVEGLHKMIDWYEQEKH